MKRLINAICRNDVEDNSETDAVDTMVQSLAEKVITTSMFLLSPYSQLQ